ncbi:hypothetical protein FKM82_012345 [Ascaphus truei]
MISITIKIIILALAHWQSQISLMSSCFSVYQQSQTKRTSSHVDIFFIFHLPRSSISILFFSLSLSLLFSSSFSLYPTLVSTSISLSFHLSVSHLLIISFLQSLLYHFKSN